MAQQWARTVSSMNILCVLEKIVYPEVVNLVLNKFSVVRLLLLFNEPSVFCCDWLCIPDDCAMKVWNLWFGHAVRFELSEFFGFPSHPSLLCTHTIIPFDS